jgi:hypothetical protein
MHNHENGEGLIICLAMVVMLVMMVVVITLWTLMVSAQSQRRPFLAPELWVTSRFRACLASHHSVPMQKVSLTPKDVRSPSPIAYIPTNDRQ